MILQLAEQTANIWANHNEEFSKSTSLIEWFIRWNNFKKEQFGIGKRTLKDALSCKCMCGEPPHYMIEENGLHCIYCVACKRAVGPHCSLQQIIEQWIEING
jgi:hypothetical protein